MNPGWLALLFEATLKSTVWLALAGLLALLLGRRSAAARHLVWAVAIVGSLLLPPLQLAIPEWRMAVGQGWTWRMEPAPRSSTELGGRRSAEASHPAVRATPTENAAAGEVPSALPTSAIDRRSWTLASSLLLVWSFGATLAFAPLAIAFLRVARISRRARPLDGARWSALADRIAEAQGLARGRLDIRCAEGPVTPLTWGVLRPVVILPDSCETWSDPQAHEVLVHEAGHVRRHDCLTQLLASAACVLYWFHPLVWLAGRRMLVERERACDDHVLLAGARPSDYANDLLEFARSCGAPWSTSQVTTAMARRSQIAGRLLAVLDPHVDRRPLHRRSALQAAALGLVVLLPLASATPATSSRDDTPGASGTTVTSPLPGTAEGPGPPPDLEQAARDLRRREREYAAAFARHDLDALAGFYTADAQVATPSLPIAYGARSVRGVLQHLLDAGIAALELETSELYPVGELVCATGHARFADASGAPVQTIRFMTLWKNEAGTWRIHRDWSTR